MKSVLITGLSGLIGTAMYKEIQARYPDCHIFGISRFKNGDLKNLIDFKGSIIRGDVSEVGDWVEFLAEHKFDCIFHFASNVNTADYSAENQIRNVEGLRNVLSLAGLHKTPVVWASSASVYGRDNTTFHETDSLAPDSPYAISKVLCENLVNSLTTLNPDWRIITIRPFNVFGPYEGHKEKMTSMVNQLIQQVRLTKTAKLFEFGDQARDFIYVKDLVDLMIRAYESGTKSNIFNGGTGVATSFKDLVSIIEFQLNMVDAVDIHWIKNPHAHYQPYTRASMNKVKSILNWEPKFNIKSAIEDLVGN